MQRKSKVVRFGLNFNGEERLELPVSATIIHVGWHNGKPCLWDWVDCDDDYLLPRVFECWGTGEEIPDGVRVHIGSCEVPNGGFFVHIFEVNQSFQQ